MKATLSLTSAIASGVQLLMISTALAEQVSPITDSSAQLPVYHAVGLGFAASLAISATVLGAAFAVAKIGSAAMGAAAEKPELLTKSILFVALAEGLAVLGFAVAMMIIQNKLCPSGSWHENYIDNLRSDNMRIQYNPASYDDSTGIYDADKLLGQYRNITMGAI